MESILKLIIRPEYELCVTEINWYYASGNTSPKITKFLLKHKDELYYPEVFKNPMLESLIVSYVSPNMAMLTNLCQNTNPNLIEKITNISIYDAVLGNPIMADYILNRAHPISSCRQISTNTNPKLAYLIASLHCWREISSNPNSGLTDFIIKNREKLNLAELSKNNNPELTDLLLDYLYGDYDQFPRISMDNISGNSNPRLTELIIGSGNMTHLARNTNPALKKYQLKNLDKINNAIFCRNPNAVVIKKLNIV